MAVSAKGCTVSLPSLVTKQQQAVKHTWGQYLQLTEISKGYSHRKTAEKKINDPKDKTPYFGYNIRADKMDKNKNNNNNNNNNNNKKHTQKTTQKRKRKEGEEVKQSKTE